MEKLDLTKKFKSYYTAKAKPELIELGLVSYLSILGKGDPSAPAFADRIQALYATAYVLKFAYKAQGKDFTVAKLEGLWWYDQARFAGISMNDAPTAIPRSEWEYRLLIRLPEFVEQEAVVEAISKVVADKGIVLADSVSYFELQEGKCVQLLHVGPFDREPESLQVIDAYCRDHGLQQNGLHHEIYLSDFRKTAPEKLKTILREPVR